MAFSTLPPPADHDGQRSIFRADIPPETGASSRQHTFGGQLSAIMRGRGRLMVEFARRSNPDVRLR